MTPNTIPRSDSPSSTISLPRQDDETVIQIHDFIHRVLDLFQARYGDQIRSFYEGLISQDIQQDIDDVDDPPF
jgi:hypothetical protein